MSTHVDQQRAIDALAAEFAAIDELLVGLSPADWKRPTALPGWDVQANVAHVIGTEAMLLEEPNPTVDIDVANLPHVRNDIGAFNEVWVVHLADASPETMLAHLRERTARRLEVIRAITPEAWDAEGFTPAGMDTYGRFTRIRVFDCWLHEQDIRDAVGRPGHESGPVVELVLDEMQGSLGYVVGKKAGATSGQSVTFELTGASGRTVHVAVAERAGLVDALPGPATTTVRLPVACFVRLAGGRSTDTSAAELEGDAELGARVLANLAYTI